MTVIYKENVEFTFNELHNGTVICRIRPKGENPVVLKNQNMDWKVFIHPGEEDEVIADNWILLGPGTLYSTKLREIMK